MLERIERIDSRIQQVLDAETVTLDRMFYSLQTSAVLLACVSAACVAYYWI